MKTLPIFALDFQNADEIKDWISRTEKVFNWYKVGMEAYYNLGPGIIHILKEKGKNIFLDLKLHDIPHTVERASKALMKLKVEMISIHLSSGKEACQRFADTLKNYRVTSLGITVLTSLNDVDMQILGFNNTSTGIVEKQLMMAEETGIDGVVCSYLELEMVKKQYPQLITVVPGITLEERMDDQKRIAHLKEVAGKSKFVVLGRAISQASDVEEALSKMVEILR